MYLPEKDAEGGIGRQQSQRKTCDYIGVVREDMKIDGRGWRGRWEMEDEHLLCADPWRERAGSKQRPGWNDETGEWVKAGWRKGGKVEWNAWVQKAARQNGWIIDAYNSRQKLKIEDKCRGINDVTRWRRRSDSGLSCMSTVASSPLKSRPPFQTRVRTVPDCHLPPAPGRARGACTGTCTHGCWCRPFKPERRVLFLSWRHVPAVTGVSWNSARLPEVLLSYFYICIFLIKY